MSGAMEQMTPYQGYVAMYEFLGSLYDTVHNDTLGALLESMRPRPGEKTPVNPGLKSMWLSTIKLSKKTGQPISGRDAYELMCEFLRSISIQVAAPGLPEVISWIALHEHDPQANSDWTEAVAKAQQSKDGW